MKPARLRPLVLGTLLSAMPLATSQACIGDGAIDGVLISVPAGTYALADAMYQAISKGQITPVANTSLNTVQFMMQRQLQQHYQGEILDITLFDSSGMHFLRLRGDGQSLTLNAHEVPKDQFQDILVTDVDALAAMARKQASFSDIVRLQLMHDATSQTEFTQLMQRTYG
ncbi:hypothetical protein [Motilimonas eburnea]|uniref:hypothetical protein n=1 Tax=Motilimonas eburnea TaxID=1737488 RepID=UPI001E54A9A9|nr:hypothetical protein [Motilimonas eburnea]MCE2569891.1 hypothetical protein [Motilimonas eburnea]